MLQDFFVVVLSVVSVVSVCTPIKLYITNTNNKPSLFFIALIHGSKCMGATDVVYDAFNCTQLS
jgi:hypothetical protein